MLKIDLFIIIFKTHHFIYILNMFHLNFFQNHRFSQCFKKYNFQLEDICNHSICNYMQLNVICNYVLSFLQLIITCFNLYNFFYDYGVTKLQLLNFTSFMLIIFLDFSSKNRPLCSISCKNSWNFYVMYIYTFDVYIKVFWNLLGIYLYIHEFSYVIFMAYWIYILHILWLGKLISK